MENVPTAVIQARECDDKDGQNIKFSQAHKDQKKNVATPVSILTQSECEALRTPNFCEENVWHILQLASRKNLKNWNLYAIFITNASRCVPFCYQRASTNNAEMCVWDYHVIAVIVDDSTRTTWIYDIDSKLPLPSTLEDYTRQSFIQTSQISYGFRVVSWNQLLDTFASDRRHMIAESCELNGTKFMSMPPKTPCIRAQKLTCKYTLPLFLCIPGAVDDKLSINTDLDDEVKGIEPGIFINGIDELIKFFSDRR